ncbi:MAG: hypothetical protein GX650_03235 [Clostridiales bacterium]|nr:hypothetical protein [Clostridiales bacterium]
MALLLVLCYTLAMLPGGRIAYGMTLRQVEARIKEADKKIAKYKGYRPAERGEEGRRH